jgi:bifunctional DNase/RNase
VVRANRSWAHGAFARMTIAGTLVLTGCAGRQPAPAAQTAPAAPATATATVRVPALTEAPVSKPDAPPDVCTDPEKARAIAPKVPFGYQEMTVDRVVPAATGAAVILLDLDKTRALAIFVGGTEATSIELRNSHQKFARPLTHDLLDSVIEKYGGHVIAARVDSIENDVFIGTLVIQKGNEAVEIDSRASDAIAMALGARAPIYVARAVVERAGVAPSELDAPSAVPTP